MRVQPNVFFKNRQDCYETNVVDAGRYQNLLEAALRKAEETGAFVHFNARTERHGMGFNTASPDGRIGGWWWSFRDTSQQTETYKDADRADYELASTFDRAALGSQEDV